ncbi:MAG: CHAT domain-containing protein [Gammaproteobacteria bacterium]
MLGQYPTALRILLAAHKVAAEIDDKTRMAAVTGSLGKTYLLAGSEEAASRQLRTSVTLARDTGNRRVLVASLNNLGKLLSNQGQNARARALYNESARLAAGALNSKLQLDRTRALAGLATLARRDKDYREAGALLARAATQIRRLPPTHAGASGLIALGKSYQRLYTDNSAAATSNMAARWASAAYRAFVDAAAVGENLGDLRTVSYARGYLGQMYAREKRPLEALQLSRQALFAAQQVNAPEISYRWQWQIARLLKRQGDVDAAIPAYRRSVHYLQSVRQDLSIAQTESQFSFRQNAGLLYFELADLLLRRASATRDARPRQDYLIEARATVEQLKTAELQDYFQDECVADLQARTTGFDRLSAHTVAVYPILLSDRTELLLSLPQGMRQVTVPVGRQALTQEIRAFRTLLEKRTTREYLPHAQQLYRWLVQPIEGELEALGVSTLVYVPDGPLRTIPMGALHDGEAFLIDNYALATTPGLTLTDPRPIERDNVRVLVGGLTESVQGFPALDYVSLELRSIRRLYRGTQLKNEQFLLPNVEQALTAAPYSIVHIASHGQFASRADQSFLLTFDDRLTMDRLEQFMGLGRYRADPVELLTLSACQTAAGDDRAALGLAGVAVKAGARSALATLWLVNDQAASLLVSEFYRQLQQPGMSKAEALQRAQVWLQSDQRYEHPGYWAAFLMIGNWL